MKLANLQHNGVDTYLMKTKPELLGWKGDVDKDTGPRQAARARIENTTLDYVSTTTPAPVVETIDAAAVPAAAPVSSVQRFDVRLSDELYLAHLLYEIVHLVRFCSHSYITRSCGINTCEIESRPAHDGNGITASVLHAC